jgi:hypothetical protein
MTTARRIAVVLALLLISVFVLHPACPSDAAAHHGPVGASSELCHHGEEHHLSPAAHTQAAVQTNTGSVAGVDVPAVTSAGPVSAPELRPRRSEHSSSGRALLLDLGISRT